MKTIFTLCCMILIFVSCNPNSETQKSNNVKRDLVINVSTEVGNGTHDPVGEATGRVQKTDDFLSIFVSSYLHDRYTPWSMRILFNNIAGKFFQNPTLEQPEKQYGDRGRVLTQTSIEGYEDVEIVSGFFPNCLKQKFVVTDNSSGDRKELESALVQGTRYLWFAKDVGIVKIRCEHSNGIITEAELIDYKITEKSESYFPLTPGTTWTYRWQDDYYKQPLIDTITVEPRNPRREGYPLNVEVKSEIGDVFGSGRFEVIMSRDYLELVTYGASYGGRHKGRDTVAGSSSIFYDHLSAIWAKLLRFPLTIGKTWEQEWMYNAQVKSTLIGYESIEIGNNMHQKCLKLESVITGATADTDANEDTLQRVAMLNGKRSLWFAKGVGVVKMRYEHSNGVITEAALTEYAVPDKSNEYFPLNIGTTWTYKWQNEYHMAPMTEKVRVVAEGSGHETPLKKAHYKISVSTDKPGEVEIECTLTPVETSGDKVRLRPSSDDAYVQDLKMVDATNNRASKSGGAGSWDFKFTRGYTAPLTLTYDVSIEYAHRIRTFRENQGWPQHLRYQTLEPDHKEDRTFWTGKALFVVGGTTRDIEVSFNLPKGWLVSTPWRSIDKENTRFEVSDQSELISSLLLIGQHSERIARSGKSSVTLAIAGDLRPYENPIHETIENYLRAYLSIFEDGPDEKVLFIINPYETEDGNGSEGRGITRSVSILMDSRLDETNRHLWGPFLGHEVFHVWNGLTALQAFSGHEHWFVEGVTDYYSDLASLHLGYLTEREYLNRIENACEQYLSVSDEYAIGDARDSRLSYQGGSLVAAALDFDIRERKKNRKNLDNVMQRMYQQFGDIKTEYTQSDIIEIANKVARKDYKPFFQDYVEGKKRLPLTAYFNKAGLDLQVTSEDLPTAEYVENVLRASLGSPDVQVIGINGLRIGSFKELRKIAKHWKSGEVVTFVYQDKEKPVTSTTTLKGILDTPPTENEIVVRINEKTKTTKLQRSIAASLFRKRI